MGAAASRDTFRRLAPMWYAGWAAHCYSGSFFHRLAAAFLARSVRCVAVMDAAAVLPPLLPSLARYFRSAAGTRFGILRA